MYNPVVNFSLDEYISTSSRNIISRKSNIQKPSALDLPLGRCFIDHYVTIRADIAPVQIQKYTFIEEGATLQPCLTTDDVPRPIPMTIGSHTVIGKRSLIEAAVMGVGCTIGDDCHIAKRFVS